MLPIKLMPRIFKDVPRRMDRCEGDKESLEARIAMHKARVQKKLKSLDRSLKKSRRRRA